MKELLTGGKQCLYTVFHPFNGFDQVKWEKKGSPKFCLLILLAFFLTSVFDQVLTGFIFNTYNPDKISVPSIFLITMGGFLIVFVANWAVSSLMFTEGELHNIFIVLCYSLTVLIIGDAVVTFASNFVATEEVMILTSIQMVCYVYFAFLVVAGLTTIHEYGFGGSIMSIIMSVVAAAIILFIGILVFTMLERMISFFSSVFEELMRRM